MSALAHREGFRRLLVPAVDAREAALIPDIEVIAVESLTMLVNHLSGVVPVEPVEHSQPPSSPAAGATDFQEVKGQEHVKRSLEVAAAGGHNVLMVWATDVLPSGPRPMAMVIASEGHDYRGDCLKIDARAIRGWEDRARIMGKSPG